MGYEVIGLGGIDIFSKISKEKLEVIASRIKTLDRENDECVIKCEATMNDKDGGYISLELSGNKGVGYTAIKQVLRELLDEGIKFEVSIGEYTENGEGLYTNCYDEDEEDIRKILEAEN